MTGGGYYRCHTELSVTSAANLYGCFKANNAFSAGHTDASLFNIVLLQQTNTIIKSIMEFFKCNLDAKSPEHKVQLWWNKLKWERWARANNVVLTMKSYDTHNNPLENGRKPDASFVPVFCALSCFTVVSLLDLKSRGDRHFSPDDKGKVIDLTKTLYEEQQSYRSGGVTSFLCNGDTVIFFIYDGKTLKESCPMNLRGLGGLWIMSMLTTNVKRLGFGFPSIFVHGKEMRITGFLGHGMSNNVFRAQYVKVGGCVEGEEEFAVRQTKCGSLVSELEIRLHEELQMVFENDGILQHMVQIVEKSDCGTALIETPVCYSCALPTSSFTFNRGQLKQIVKIGVALQKAGMVHLDLRISNLLINCDNLIVLADMGSLVKLSEEYDQQRNVALSGTTKYGSPGMLKHLCSNHPHTPSAADDCHSILRVIYVSTMRGAYERLFAINVTDETAIAAFWASAFSSPFWARYVRIADRCDYSELDQLVDLIGLTD